jgi:glutaconate CoA-transferase subunit B
MHATPEELMTLAAARALEDGDVCFVGIGLPSTAANLARLTHAPNIVLIYESGTIGAQPSVLPLSIGDGELATTADTVVPTPEVFRYWLQGGRIDVGFLGAAQIDRHGRLNSTVIGPYERPRTRLPGAGGAPEIAALSRRVLVVIQQSPRTFVERLDFVTTRGRPSRVITDLGVLEPSTEIGELVATELHAGVTRARMREATGWAIRFAEPLREAAPPDDRVLAALRGLKGRTASAHATRSAPIAPAGRAQPEKR